MNDRWRRHRIASLTIPLALVSAFGCKRRDDEQPVSGEPAESALQLPASRATAPVPDGEAYLVVTTDRIELNDETILEFVNGEIRLSDRASADSPLLPDLTEALREWLRRPRERDPAEYEDVRWSPSLSLAIDGRIDYRVVSFVVMSASAAGYQRFAVVTRPASHSQLWVETDALHSLQRWVLPLYVPTQADIADWPAVPRLVVAIRSDGTLIIADMLQSEAFTLSRLGAPGPDCPEPSPPDPRPTICPSPERAAAATVTERIDFRALYNRLSLIRRHGPWRNLWTEQSALINVIAELDVPWEAVVRTIDIASQLLEQDQYPDDESFRSARLREPTSPLFPRAVTLLPRDLH